MYLKNKSKISNKHIRTTTSNKWKPKNKYQFKGSMLVYHQGKIMLGAIFPLLCSLHLLGSL